MIAELLINNLHRVKNQQKAIDITEINRDTATCNLLQEQLEKTKKRIWFQFEVNTAGKNEYKIIAIIDFKKETIKNWSYFSIKLFHKRVSLSLRLANYQKPNKI